MKKMKLKKMKKNEEDVIEKDEDENDSFNSESKTDEDVGEDQCVKSFKLAFDKTQASNRKAWLKNYDKDNILTQDQKKVSYTDYVNKDLIHFSNYDNKRSIPNLCDGLKPSQRKILYSVFKKKSKEINKSITVSGIC